MSTLDAIKWFKEQFGAAIANACAGTPFTVDLLTAIAMQETYSDAWRLTYKTKPVADVLKFCVGDTLDRTKTFPKNKADLVAYGAHGEGRAMFDIARQALLDLAAVNPDYAPVSHNPNKFCHGFGIFQYDIQFLKTPNADFFLHKKWYDFGACLKQCLVELQTVADHIYPDQQNLDDTQLIYVAIGYNTGPHGVSVGGGFAQGHEDGGVYYGQQIDKYLHLAHTVPGPQLVAAAE